MRGHSCRRTGSKVAAVLAALAAIVVAVLAAGCGGTSSVTTISTTAPLSTVVTQGSGANAQGPNATFTINKGTLSPTKIEVPVGSAVTWLDTDDDNTRTYEFVADNGSFTTGTLGQGGSFTYTFQKAGTYSFHEKSDPSIKGTVVVD
jgi:plastocyanin